MQIKIYTESWTNLTTWDTKDSSYVISGTAFSTNSDNWDSGNTTLGNLYVFSIVVSLLLTIASVIIIFYLIYKKTPNNSESDEFKIWHSLFWTTVGVLAQFNALFLIIDIVYIGIWCNSPTGCSGAGNSKIFWLFYTGFIALASSILYPFLLPFLIIKKYMREREVPTVPFLEVEPEKLQLMFPPIVSPLCFVVCHSYGKSKCATYFFGIILSLTLVIFLSAIFFYVLPVLVLLLVYPIKVVAAYSFLTAALALYILIAFYGEYKRKYIMLLPDAFFRQPFMCFYLNVPLLNMMLISLIFLLFVSVYNVISDGYAQNSVIHAIVSFLPSLILSFLIWLFKKQFSQRLSDARRREYPLTYTEELRPHPQRQYGATNEHPM